MAEIQPQLRRESLMFASVTSDVLLWTLIVGFIVNGSLNRMFGQDWPKRLGESLIGWMTRKREEKPEGESGGENADGKASGRATIN